MLLVLPVKVLDADAGADEGAYADVDDGVILAAKMECYLLAMIAEMLVCLDYLIQLNYYYYYYYYWHFQVVLLELMDVVLTMVNSTRSLAIEECSIIHFVVAVDLIHYDPKIYYPILYAINLFDQLLFFYFCVKCFSNDEKKNER